MNWSDEQLVERLHDQKKIVRDIGRLKSDLDKIKNLTENNFGRIKIPCSSGIVEVWLENGNSSKIIGRTLIRELETRIEQLKSKLEKELRLNLNE